MGGCFRRGGFRGWMGEVVGEWGSGGVIFIFGYIYVSVCMYGFLYCIDWMDGWVQEVKKWRRSKVFIASF